MADGRGGEEELNHHSSMLPLNNSTETSPSPVLGAGAAAGGIPGRSTAGIDGGPELRSDQLKAQGRPSDSKEEVLKLLGRALVLPVVDGRYKTPVVTLHNSDTSNLYSLIERQLRGEYLVGAEKFWKVVRADQNLDTWRPRVHGTQLKALLNCRLPESEDEYRSVEQAVTGIKYALRPDTSPQRFVSDLRKFIAGVEVWWDNRNSRRPAGDSGNLQTAGSLKRPAASMAGPAGNSKGQGGQNSQQPMSGAVSTTPKKANTGTMPGGRPFDGLNPGGQMFPQPGQGMMRGYQGYGENGMPKQESPDELHYTGNGGVDFNIERLLQGQGAAGPSGMVHAPLPGPHDPRAIVYLNVGGKQYTTTVGTLLCVPGTYFWEVLGDGAGSGRAAHAPGGHQEMGVPMRTQGGELFIDRDAKMFKYILEYLRAVCNNEHFSPLPHDATELACLAREAQFFGLPGLLDRINGTAIVPEPNTRAVYDSIYLETGFSSIEGPNIKEMEQRKVVVMQQMNHVLAQKSMDGFFVAACDCGVNHRDGPDGTQHNLYYHILLKKVLPMPMGLGPGGGMPQGLPQGAGAQQMHAGMQMQPGAGGLQMPPLPLSMPVPRRGGM